MGRDIRAILIETIKLPGKKKSFLATLLGWISFPVSIVVSTVMMVLVISYLGVRAFLNLFKKPSDIVSDNTNTLALEPWHPFLSSESIRLWQKYRGEIRFGPAYFYLKSEPAISYLIDKTFGDWHCRTEDGWLLQEWNNLRTPNTNLIYINSKTLEARIILENIPSVLWEAHKEPNGSLKLSCNTGEEIITFKIEL